jgi:hypothetical protein
MPEDDRPSVAEPVRRGSTDLRTVSLLEQECVTGRGTSHVLWYVREPRGWTKAALVAGSVAQDLPASPGMVWARHVELTLEVGALLMRVTTEPGSGGPRSPLDHLLSGSPPARRVSRAHYVVGSSGALKPLAPRAKRI